MPRERAPRSTSARTSSGNPDVPLTGRTPASIARRMRSGDESTCVNSTSTSARASVSRTADGSSRRRIVPTTSMPISRGRPPTMVLPITPSGPATTTRMVLERSFPDISLHDTLCSNMAANTRSVDPRTTIDIGPGGLEVLRRIAALPRWPEDASDALRQQLLVEESVLRDELISYGYAMDSGDVDAVMEYFSDDVVITNPRGRYTG